LLLSAGAMQQSIDISRPPGAEQQTRRSGMRQSNDGTDGQTGRRTLDSFIDPAAHATRTLSSAVRPDDFG